MDNSNLGHKKRRNKGNYEYQQPPRYKKHSREESGRNWKTDNYRSDDSHYHGRHQNQIRDSEKQWDIQIHLIGKKSKDTMIHICETCALPIKSYGRMIPCKHVFCFSCAKKTDNNCPRCKDAVQRIEQCPLGSVYLCAVSNNCKRTYLSNRDLQAHINHRHSKQVTQAPVMPLVMPPQPVSVPPPPITVPPPTLLPHPTDPFMMVSASRSATTHVPPNVVMPPVTSDTLGVRPSSNLITIQIQDQRNVMAPSQNMAYPPPPPPGKPRNYVSQQPTTFATTIPNVSRY